VVGWAVVWKTDDEDAMFHGALHTDAVKLHEAVWQPTTGGAAEPNVDVKRAPEGNGWPKAVLWLLGVNRALTSALNETVVDIARGAGRHTSSDCGALLRNPLDSDVAAIPRSPGCLVTELTAGSTSGTSQCS